jgi:hypothetical protein
MVNVFDSSCASPGTGNSKEMVSDTTGRVLLALAPAFLEESYYSILKIMMGGDS